MELISYRKVFIIFYIHLIYYPVESTTLECSYARPMKLTRELRADLHGSTYWTRLYLMANYLHLSTPQGFLRLNDLVRTYLKFETIYLKSYSLISSALDTLVDYHEHMYIVDKTHAIFESHPHAKGRMISKRKDGEKPSIGILYNMTQPATRFALIKIGSQGGYRIFESCDGRDIWIQMSDQAYEYDLMEGFTPIDRFLEDILNVLHYDLGIEPIHVQPILLDRFPFDVNLTKIVRSN